MIIGSHCSFNAPNYLLGAVNETLANQANALMIYTGAPQNARRTALAKLKITEGLALMQENGIAVDNLIIHAPYLINLANTLNPTVISNSRDLLEVELARSCALKAKTIVLHPGAYLKADKNTAIAALIENLRDIAPKYPDVTIALETMAGKGSEIGSSFEEIATIIAGVKSVANLHVCLDTCHIHDAGYDLTNFSQVLAEFERIIGLDKLAVIHLNDSKNIRGSKKDRHANIGYGEIGFKSLYQILTRPELKHLPFILETPYYASKPPYQMEIALLKQGQFSDWQK